MDKEKLHDCSEENCDCSEENCDCSEENCDCQGDSCGCGCDCDCEDAEQRYVDFEDEEGKIVSYEIVDELEYNGNEYVLVQNPEDNSVYILKANSEDPEELEIPTEEEFEEVSAYLESLAQE